MKFFKDDEVCKEKKAKLHQYPKLESQKYNDHLLVLGDLHGNALKFIRHLIKHNRYKICKENYAELVKIYSVLSCYISMLFYNHYYTKLKTWEGLQQANHLSNEKISLKPKLKNYVDSLKKRFEAAKIEYKAVTHQSFSNCSLKEIKFYLNQFRRILDEAEVASSAPITLLGDDVNDRSMAADCLIFWIYESLTKKKINYSIIHSNHGLELLGMLEGKINFKKIAFPKKIYAQDNLNSYNQFQSFQHLALLIHLGIINEAPMRETIQYQWRFHLNAVGYHINGNVVTVFTHAFNGHVTLQSLARAFEAKYSDTDVDAFAKAIDDCNLKYAILNNNNLVYQAAGLAHFSSPGGLNIPQEYPLARLAYSRDPYKSAIDSATPKKNKIIWRFVHGHHTYGHHLQENCLSLNDESGKEPTTHGRKSYSLRLKIDKNTNLFIPPPEQKSLQKRVCARLFRCAE